MSNTNLTLVVTFFLAVITASVYAAEQPREPVLDKKCRDDVFRSGSMDYNAATKWCTYFVVPGDAMPGTTKGAVKGPTKG